jgi:hypothetical protein
MKYLGFGLLFLICCTSCNQIFYSPNTSHAPLFSQKGEARMNGTFSIGAVTEITGGEVQLAYAASPHIGLMTNGFTASKTEGIGSGKLSYIEFAPGWYSLQGKSKELVTEVYAGYGKGHVRNNYQHNEFSKSSFDKFFLQPAIGYKGKNIEAIFVPKLSHVRLKFGQDNLSHSDNSFEKDVLNQAKSDPTLTMFEPSLIFRAGGEKFKGQLTINNSTGRGFILFDVTETCLFSLGVSVNLKPKKN